MTTRKRHLRLVEGRGRRSPQQALPPRLGAAGPRPAPVFEDDERAEPAPPLRRRRLSTLGLRILAPNLLVVAVLVAGIFGFDQYRNGLIEAEVAALRVQGRIVAEALGESALAGPALQRRLDPEAARTIVRQVSAPMRTRIRLFGADGGLLADSRTLAGAGREVRQRALPPPEDDPLGFRFFGRLYDSILPLLPPDDTLPLYREDARQRAADYTEVGTALRGETGALVRKTDEGGLLISVAVPVQPLRQVLGALMLSVDGDTIEQGVRDARVVVLQLGAAALAITVFSSLWIAGTIARPLRRLAQASERVRRRRGEAEIPDLTGRRDEIGDLSGALAEMTRALTARLDAIDSFAADVAHEFKNPLGSMMSAVESLSLAREPAQRERLLAVLQDDVRRLDRLISEISNASRLDAELLRQDREPFDLIALVATAIEVSRQRPVAAGREVRLETTLNGLWVEGLPGRFGQVVDNLIANALSFTPDGGAVVVRAERRADAAVLRVDDDGPGVPEAEKEKVFDRFYSRRRPGSEGQHSGLGLSIARQIVEAHRGAIVAENRYGPDGSVLGARFRVTIPLVD